MVLWAMGIEPKSIWVLKPISSAFCCRASAPRSLASWAKYTLQELPKAADISWLPWAWPFKQVMSLPASSTAPWQL